MWSMEWIKFAWIWVPQPHFRFLLQQKLQLFLVTKRKKVAAAESRRRSRSSHTFTDRQWSRHSRWTYFEVPLHLHGAMKSLPITTQNTQSHHLDHQKRWQKNHKQKKKRAPRFQIHQILSKWTTRERGKGPNRRFRGRFGIGTAPRRRIRGRSRRRPAPPPPRGLWEGRSSADRPWRSGSGGIKEERSNPKEKSKREREGMYINRNPRNSSSSSLSSCWSFPSLSLSTSLERVFV